MGEKMHTQPKTAAEYRVGTLVKLKVPCLGNAPGTVGVVYEVYARTWATRDDEGAYGISVIFPNGRHDGFSDSEVRQFLTYVGESRDPGVRAYRFTNAVNLCRDFRAGRFTCAFGEGQRNDESCRDV